MVTLHKLATQIHGFIVPSYDASTTISLDTSGLVLATLLFLLGSKGH